MFIDASAFCSVLLNEPDRETYFSVMLKPRSVKLTSSVAAWETMRAIVRDQGVMPEQARQDVEAFLSAMAVSMVPVGETEYGLAVEAFGHFGKGRHPARLNMADCFAYACARRHGVPLLFKGEDFSQTDINSALGP